MKFLMFKKNPQLEEGGEWKNPDKMYYRDKNGVTHILTALYRGPKKLWELITGFLFTKDDFAIQTKDDFIVKCKDQ